MNYLLVWGWVLWLIFGWGENAIAVSDRVSLSLELLQERLNTPVLSEGVSFIDLTHFNIDLTDKNTEFREQFYQKLQTQINRSKTPLGIDISDSILEGELNISKLSLPIFLSKITLPPLLNALEQEQLQKDPYFIKNNGEQGLPVNLFRGIFKFERTLFRDKVDLSKTFFLQRLEGINATFNDELNAVQTRFSRTTDFSQVTFSREVNFTESHVFSKIRFLSAHFLGSVKFIRSRFEDEVNFQQAKFNQLAEFNQTKWQKSANFNQVNWRDRVLFSKSIFLSSLSLINNTFEKSVAFRTTHFMGVVNLKDVKLLSQVDFSNAIFTSDATINVAGLAFDSEQAKLLGDTGVIGEVISIPNLEGNETFIRNLIQNFRHLEQIADANQVEYKKEKLRFKELSGHILNTSLKDILRLRLLGYIFAWITLSFLLLLSEYGTNFYLVFGIGIVSIAYFGFIFWLIDRFRRRIHHPMIPSQYQTYSMVISYMGLTGIGVIDIFGSSDKPWMSLLCLSLILFPFTLGLVIRLYQQGRYHDLMESSYFVKDGSLRQLQLLIIRLPVIPEFPFYRDRFTPLPWNRRWNWLNYYDFSSNNFIKLGFNDIRLRDQHLPSIISILVWYQWSLGILYIVMLLWTLSRTIPGLNLLIYLK